MKKSVLLAWFLLCINIVLFGQKNTLSFVYTPAITKLNTNYLAKNAGLAMFYYWYTTRKPDKPMYGYNIGFTYQRKLSNKIALATGLFVTELKQHTGYFYGDKKFEQPPTEYLASELVLKYRGTELPITISYLASNSKKWEMHLEFGASINLIDYFEAQDYIIALKDGSKQGCCTTFLNSPTTIQTVGYKLSKAYFIRLGVSIGYEFAYNIHSHWQLSFTPLFKYYSNALKDKDTFGALDADAYFWGLQSKINFKF